MDGTLHVEVSRERHGPAEPREVRHGGGEDTRETPSPGRHGPASSRERAAIIEHYTRTLDDYRHWSPSLHMHFGCWRWPLSPLAREPMLDALARSVHERLALPTDARGTVLDLGCGVGCSARLLASTHRRVEVLGLTVTPAQVALGKALGATAQLDDRVRLIEADYRAIPRASSSAIAAYAIESACYDPNDGAGLIAEAARVLEPGARLVIADGFRRAPLRGLALRCELEMAKGWALPDFNERPRFEAHLRAHGFEILACEDFSLRVLPSVLHVPAALIGHRLRRGAALEPAARAHLRAALWCLIGALTCPRSFGYFLITARKPPAKGC